MPISSTASAPPIGKPFFMEHQLADIFEQVARLPSGARTPGHTF
jgi:hypothetical protein